jgi:sensor histidine kinase regulating citrate/malate metabolism
VPLPTNGETGTGFGLWVASEIMKKNGWSIKMRSNGIPPCNGTILSIAIPKMTPR